MASFEWKPEYSVNDDTIDGQHRELIAILNELAGHLTRGDTAISDETRTVFDHLAQYITDHFAYEEGRMVDAGYPEEKVAAHRGEHNKFLRQVQDYENLFESGDPAALEQMMPFLYGEWLIHHICGTDKDYVPYLEAGR